MLTFYILSALMLWVVRLRLIWCGIHTSAICFSGAPITGLAVTRHDSDGRRFSHHRPKRHTDLGAAWHRDTLGLGGPGRQTPQSDPWSDSYWKDCAASWSGHCLPLRGFNSPKKKKKTGATFTASCISINLFRREVLEFPKSKKL